MSTYPCLGYSVTDANEARQDQNGIWTCTVRLKAKMASIDNNRDALVAGLPQYQRYKPHPNAKNFKTEVTLFASEFEAVQIKNTVFWDVLVTYTSSLIENPLDVPAIIGELQTYTMPGGTLRNSDGEAILNTAGEPPEPFDKPQRILQIPIIKNIPADVPGWLFNWEDCTNSDAVSLPNGDSPLSCAPHTLLINSIKTSAIQQMGDIKYRQMTMELLYRPSTWYQIFPSRGFNQLITQKVLVTNPSTGAVSYSTRSQLTPILIKGEVPTEAQFLDADGKWIQNPTPDDVVYLQELIHTEAEFSSFPLA